jgi:hypothetical protein
LAPLGWKFSSLRLPAKHKPWRAHTIDVFFAAGPFEGGLSPAGEKVKCNRTRTLLQNLKAGLLPIFKKEVLSRIISNMRMTLEWISWCSGMRWSGGNQWESD